MRWSRFFALILTSICSLGVKAQESKPQLASDLLNRTNDHTFYIEFGGSAYYYSVNYERKLLFRKQVAWFARLGFEYIPIKPADMTVHIPLASNVVLFKKKHRLELGIGALFRLDFSPGVGFGEGFYLTTPPTRIFITPMVGYRYISKPNDYGETFIIRVTFTPLMGMDVFNNGPYFLPHAGISVGRTWSRINKKRKK
jgi:hypothetical protein